MSENNVLLSVKDLVVEYSSGGDIIHAVNGVSFDLEKGKTLGLVGETGAGKTTVAKSIIRVLQTPPAKIAGGEICFKGEDLLTKTNDEMTDIRGREISMIFQDPMTALNPTMSIGNQIAESILRHTDLSAAQAKLKALEMLDKVGIHQGRYNDFPYQFSGGMKQRVVIALALVFAPELLLADEPTTALDVTIQAQILETIRGFKEGSEMSMILITHDLGIVAENCDMVAVIYAGQILEYGTKADIFKNPTHPYTKGLFASLPGAAKGKRRLQPIDGFPPDPRDLPLGCPFAPRCPHATDECRQAPVENVKLSDTHICKCRLAEV